MLSSRLHKAYLLTSLHLLWNFAKLIHIIVASKLRKFYTSNNLLWEKTNNIHCLRILSLFWMSLTFYILDTREETQELETHSWKSGSILTIFFHSQHKETVHSDWPSSWQSYYFLKCHSHLAKEKEKGW